MQFSVIATVFVIIFVAELPDKTMIATLIMGSRYRPVLVWLGATLAFGVHATIAVAVGQLLQLLPHRWIEGVTAFIEAHPLPSGGKTVEQILERLAVNVAFGQREAAGLAGGLTGSLDLPAA